MSELSDVRESIGVLLDSVTALKTVQRYERADIASSLLPAATIFLMRVGRPGYDTAGLPRFGPNDYEAEWRINVRLSNPQPGYEVTSQQLFESVFAGLRAALAANSGQLINTDSSTTTFVSLTTNGELLIPQDATSPFVAQYTLTTLTLT